jgi:hypothetical protein
MSFDAKLCELSAARKLVLEQLTLPAATSAAMVPDPVVAEYLRSSLFELSRAAGHKPVYVTALTNRVREQLAPLWRELSRERKQRPSRQEQELEGDTAPDPIRRVLQALGDLREAVHVGRGYWLPGPVRLVDLRIGNALVIGGMSTAALRKFVPDISLDWIARLVPMQALPPDLPNLASRWQALDGWLGAPPKSLEEWTDARLEQARNSLVQSASDLVDFEVYDPIRRGREPQAFRWIEAREYATTGGLVLCRSSYGFGRTGPRNYWLGMLTRSGDTWRVEREAPVDSEDIRRLQYGLDRKADTPVRIFTQERSKDVVLTLRNLLPPEERRLLITLAEERSDVMGRFPLKYVIGHETYPALRAALAALGIELTQRQ